MPFLVPGVKEKLIKTYQKRIQNGDYAAMACHNGSPEILNETGSGMVPTSAQHQKLQFQTGSGMVPKSARYQKLLKKAGSGMVPTLLQHQKLFQKTESGMIPTSAQRHKFLEKTGSDMDPALFRSSAPVSPSDHLRSFCRCYNPSTKLLSGNLPNCMS